MLSAHYRSPLNFSADLMEASKNGLERIITCMEKLRDLESKASGNAETCDEQNSMAPVSYTHLDVYKRQGERRI